MTAKKSVIFFLILISIAGSVLFLTACDRGDSSPENIVKEGHILVPAEAYRNFVQVRRAAPVDFNYLTKIYRDGLKQYLIDVDRDCETAIEGKVEQALGDCRHGRNPAGNAQVAEKYIQYAFYRRFLHSLDKMKAGA